MTPQPGVVPMLAYADGPAAMDCLTAAIMLATPAALLGPDQI